jgi:hypothetical protein
MVTDEPQQVQSHNLQRDQHLRTGAAIAVAILMELDAFCQCQLLVHQRS